MVDSAKMASASAVPIFETANGQKYAFNPFSSVAVHAQTVIQKQSSENSKNREECHDYCVRSSENSKEEECHNYCAHCRLSFVSQLEYDHHNVEMHNQKKLLTCSECTATFRRQDHLKRHMRSLHLNQKYCTCPVCKKDYKRQDILLKHIKRKHDGTLEIFHCRECDFECRSHTELEKHEFTHILTDRHVCSYCNATFKRRDHMLRHVKSQHLNQSVICPVCNQSYKRKDHVVRHVREKHKMGYLNGKLITSQDML